MEPVEIRPVPGIAGYGASADGRIWSRRLRGPGGYMRDEWMLVKPFMNDSGYLRVRVALGGGQGANKRVHRLVWLAFRGEIPDHLQLNHLDGNKTNNRVDNLELVTLKENMSHSYEIGLRDGMVGDKAKQAKLTEKAVVQARKQYRQGGISISALAREHGVCHRTMRDALFCRTWNRIKEPV